MMRAHAAESNANGASDAARQRAQVSGLVLLVCAAGPGLAQTSPAHGPLPTVSSPSAFDDRELADYLALLQRIAPASETAARTYLAAMRLRCGQALDAAALRRAMAREGGDPVLMGLIRAAATQDRRARHEVVAQIQCARGERP